MAAEGEDGGVQDRKKMLVSLQVQMTQPNVSVRPVALATESNQIVVAWPRSSRALVSALWIL